MFTKAALRTAALAHRQALSGAEVTDRSAELAARLFDRFDVATWRWLHLFLPLAARHEPDTWHIIRRIWAETMLVQLAVPVMQPGSNSLKHYELTPNTPLAANHWGIPEPDPAEATAVPPSQLDAVLVPLLAADRRGHRVGYGGGYYDRFLTQCPPATRFIGLSILEDEPVAKIANVQPTDVPLHALLTPGRVWHFG